MTACTSDRIRIDQPVPHRRLPYRIKKEGQPHGIRNGRGYPPPTARHPYTPQAATASYLAASTNTATASTFTVEANRIRLAGRHAHTRQGVNRIRPYRYTCAQRFPLIAREILLGLTPYCWASAF